MSSQGVWFLFEFFPKKKGFFVKIDIKKSFMKLNKNESSNTLSDTIRERDDAISKLNTQSKELNEARKFLIMPQHKRQKKHIKYMCTKTLFRLYVCFKSKCEKLSQQLQKFAQENKDQKDKIDSLNAEKSAMFEEIEVCNSLKQTNAQLSSEVQDLRGRICKLTIGVGIESKFPAVNDIATTYEGISDNYRLNLTSEIITQLEDNEKIKEKYTISFLARFSHC
ncbi:hypothetical protein RFI_33907, partial [Reticulomyxa filosa]